MASPYDGLAAGAFWRRAVAEGDPASDRALYVPRAPVTPETRIFAAGSCFAQHVTRSLRAAGCHVVDTEPMRVPIPEAAARAFGYGLYSARFGNIYTLRQFRQLIDEAQGRFSPALPVWERGGRYFDALRPAVEPRGLDSPEQVAEARALHLGRVRKALGRTDLVVFTLGLTECWEHAETGTVYPTAPETVAGRFDADVFRFRNLTYEECLEDFAAIRAALLDINPDIRFLLTVSPVPLTATASGGHVLPASTLSKAILRAVCGTLYDRDERVDYFPSYELVTAPRPGGGHWFEDNLRTPSAEAVARVMACFLAAHGLEPKDGARAEDVADPLCEEVLLESFAR